MPIPKPARPSEPIQRHFTWSLLGVVLIFGSGDFLSHPGIGLWPAALLSYIPVLRALERGEYKLTVFGLGAGGAVAWMLALNWMPTTLISFFSVGVIFAGCGTLALAAVQALPYFLGAGLAALLVRARLPSWLALALGVGLAEKWTPTLIPYSHAVPLIETGIGRHLLSVLGRDICTMVIIIGNWMLYCAVRKPVRRRITLVGLSIVTLLFALSWPLNDPGDEKQVTIGLLQSNFPVEAKRRDPSGVLAWHRQFSEAAPRDSQPDFLVWGETVLSLPRSAAAHRRDVAQLDLPPVLFGAVVRSELCPTCSSTNSVLISKECGSNCRYDKQELVPGAEGAWPGAALLLSKYSPRFVSSLQREPINISHLRMGTPICFEALFPKRIAHFARQGARLLVNIVSDGWVESAMASSAMEGLSRLGAVEWGLPLVRLVDRGGSAAWNSEGIEVSAIPSGQSGYFPVTISMPSRLSFYGRHYELLEVAFKVLTAIIMVLLLVFSVRQRCALGTPQAATSKPGNARGTVM